MGPWPLFDGKKTRSVQKEVITCQTQNVTNKRVPSVPPERGNQTENESGGFSWEVCLSTERKFHSVPPMGSPFRPAVQRILSTSDRQTATTVYTHGRGVGAHLRLSRPRKRPARITEVTRQRRREHQHMEDQLARKITPFQFSPRGFGISLIHQSGRRPSSRGKNTLKQCRPTASISSMKTMQGACFLASVKRSLIRRAPTPTNISSNSEPEAWMKGTPASPAMARARRVLPVPGEPDIITPFGNLAPNRVKRSGSLR